MVKYVIECIDEARNESKFDDLLNETIYSIACAIACGSAAVDIRKNVSLPSYSIAKGKCRISKSLRAITQQEKLLAFLDFIYLNILIKHLIRIECMRLRSLGEYVDSCNKDNMNHLDYPNFAESEKKTGQIM